MTVKSRILFLDVLHEVGLRSAYIGVRSKSGLTYDDVLVADSDHSWFSACFVEICHAVFPLLQRCADGGCSQTLLYDGDVLEGVEYGLDMPSNFDVSGEGAIVGVLRGLFVEQMCRAWLSLPSGGEGSLSACDLPERQTGLLHRLLLRRRRPER